MNTVDGGVHEIQAVDIDDSKLSKDKAMEYHSQITAGGQNSPGLC